MAHGDLIRRARSLVLYWNGDDLVARNYLTTGEAIISPQVASILAKFTRWQRESTVRRKLQALISDSKVVSDLLSQGLLVKKESELARRDECVERSWAWGVEGRLFHFTTQRASFLSLAAERRQLAKLVAASAPPSPFLKREGPRIPLLSTLPTGGGEFWTTLSQRRTVRTYSRRAVSAQAFETVICAVWGMTHSLVDPVLGPFILKTTPSGGARHPIEVYPLILNVEGLRPGLYHYCVASSNLTLLSAGRFAKEAVKFCADQPWLKHAGFICFLTAVLSRSMWKYKSSHAYRVILLDAGHLGQTFHLVCTYLGLGPFTTAALNSASIEKFLGIDGMTEVVVYAAAAGVPADTRNSGGLRVSQPTLR